MSTNDRRAFFSRTARRSFFVLAALATLSPAVTAKANAPMASATLDAGTSPAQNRASARQVDLRAEGKCDAAQTAGCPNVAGAAEDGASSNQAKSGAGTGAAGDGASSNNAQPAVGTGAPTATNAGEHKNENERIATARSFGTILREKWETITAWSITLLAIAFSGYLVRQQRRSDQLVLSLRKQIASPTGEALVPLEARNTAQAPSKNALAVTKAIPTAPGREADQLKASGNAAISRASSEPLHRLAEAGRAIAAEALVCFEQLESNKDFVKLNEVGKLRDAVTNVDARLKRLSEGDVTPDDHPIQILCAGGFNEILTLSPLIEVYFSDQDDWYEMCRVMSTLGEFTRLLLARYGVEVYVVKPLTRLVSYRGDKETQDFRGIKKLEAVRAAVGKQAATINQGESLIVDCLSPGYIIPGVGSTPPRMCFYNPSAWT